MTTGLRASPKTQTGRARAEPGARQGRGRTPRPGGSEDTAAARLVVPCFGDDFSAARIVGLSVHPCVGRRGRRRKGELISLFGSVVYLGKTRSTTPPHVWARRRAVDPSRGDAYLPMAASRLCCARRGGLLGRETLAPPQRCRGGGGVRPPRLEGVAALAREHVAARASRETVHRPLRVRLPPLRPRSGGPSACAIGGRCGVYARWFGTRHGLDQHVGVGPAHASFGPGGGRARASWATGARHLPRSRSGRVR